MEVDKLNTSGGKVTDFGFESMGVDPLTRQKTTNYVPEKAEYQLEVTEGSDKTRPAENGNNPYENIAKDASGDKMSGGSQSKTENANKSEYSYGGMLNMFERRDSKDSKGEATISSQKKESEEKKQ